MRKPAPVGFIGLGKIGGPMARRLASLGVPLLVYDINPKAMAAVVKCGARAARSPKAIAAEASVVFTSLPSLESLRQVVLGDKGLHLGRAIKTYVDLSTSGSQIARELSAALRKSDITMLDAPVVGTPDMAVDGTLGIACSGPRVAFRNAEPYLNQLGSVVVDIGTEPGQAQTMKLVNNLLSQTGMAASCEAFILGVKAGLDPDVMLEVFNSGEANSHATRKRIPRYILTRKFNAGVRMAITIKDITMCMKEADDLGVPMWIGQAARQIWAYAISQGASENDGTTLITHLEPWAGVEVRGAAGGGRKPTAMAGRLTPKPNAVTDHDLLLLCDERMHAALAKRLQGQRGKNHSCTLSRVTAGTEYRDVVGKWQRARGRKRAQVIVNLCSMASTEAVALHALVTRRDVSYLDAPLTGTPRDAERGTLTITVSGPQTAAEQAQALLHAIGSQVFYIGKQPGSAQVMHQINGSLSSTLFAVACEAFVAGAKAGLTPEAMTKVMSIDTGRNDASARIMPEQVATRRFKHGKRIVDACSELALVNEEARRQGVTMWISGKTRQLYEMASYLGKPEEDMTRLITHYEKWSDVEVRGAAPRKRCVSRAEARS